MEKKLPTLVGQLTLKLIKFQIKFLIKKLGISV